LNNGVIAESINQFEKMARLKGMRGAFCKELLEKHKPTNRLQNVSGKIFETNVHLSFNNAVK